LSTRANENPDHLGRGATSKSLLSAQTHPTRKDERSELSNKVLTGKG